MVVQQQRAAVPDARMAPLELDKMAIDLGAALVGERPRPRRVSELQPFDAHDGDIAHASSVPSVTTTASPPIEAEASLPACVTIASRIRLGRPIS